MATCAGIRTGTHVPNSLLPKIGHIAVRHSYLDVELNQNIWKLLGTTVKQGQAITDSMFSFDARLKLFLILATQRYPRYKKQLNLIYHQLRNVNEDRNRLIHGPITYNERTRDRFRTAAGHWFDKASLDDIADRLVQCHVILFTIRANGTQFWQKRNLPTQELSPTKRLQDRKAAKAQRAANKKRAQRASHGPSTT